MKKSEYIDVAIGHAYRLESLLRVLSLALDGEEISSTSFADSGGGCVIDLAAKMAGEITEGLEIGGNGKAV